MNSVMFSLYFQIIYLKVLKLLLKQNFKEMAFIRISKMYMEPMEHHIS